MLYMLSHVRSPLKHRNTTDLFGMSELQWDNDSIPKIMDEALKSPSVEMGHVGDLTPAAPSEGPISWPKWKKNLQIWMVAFHSLMTTFMAAGIIPATATLADMYGIYPTRLPPLAEAKAIGIPAGPLVMGVVSQHLGVQWVFWIFAILNLVQLIAYLVFGAETLPLKEPISSQAPQSVWRRWEFRRLDPAPFKLVDLIRPLFLARNLEILIPGLAYAFTFCYATVAISVEMPTVFGEKFNLNAQQIGLQFIALIIGCILGDQLSGPCSDFLLRFLRRRKGRSCPADRLWLSYVGYGTTIAGLLIWGFQVQHAVTWNITPCVGAGFAAFGNQVVTTTLVAFAVDSSEQRSTDVGLFTNFCRQIYGFIGPFYFPAMFEGLGMGGAAGVMCALIAVSALAPTIFIQMKSSRAHRGESEV
ncbi:hypothetical protein FE257_012913 [Aspergillus nanangensis]|uniref:MFS general substrate transporter n=1 Tax=Aspergillus nanangensis TaxID=2582783 RepID=A0AAD4GQG4_ASPNN|nr:hypothetical protein FE257_012913 [Aspergillus nanangensis]